MMLPRFRCDQSSHVSRLENFVDSGGGECFDHAGDCVFGQANINTCGKVGGFGFVSENQTERKALTVEIEIENSSLNVII